jgi:uncharacterized surface protein with fasciclin (FAS1) repeats
MKTIKALFLTILFSGFLFNLNLNAQCDSPANEKTNDIVDLAVSSDFLTTLVAAVKAGDLVETLKGEGPFTVFAPTDEAFAALPEGTLESLLLPENKDKLIAVLTYHVVPGEVKSTDLSNGMSATTVQGSDIKISISDDGVQINDASVTTADIMAENGVVHVIDRVILPTM